MASPKNDQHMTPSPLPPSPKMNPLYLPFGVVFKISSVTCLNAYEISNFMKIYKVIPF